MEIKYALFLFPLTWAIMIHLLSGTLENLAIVAIVSFIASGIATILLAGFHVLSSGLNDSATIVIFILIFGGLFYGISASNLNLSGTQYSFNTLNPNSGVIIFDSYDSVNIDLQNIPPYIKTVVIGTKPINSVTIQNPNFDENAEIPEGTAIGGYGISASTGLNNSMFTDMPYFYLISVILGIMYVFGMYLLIAK